MKHQLVIEYDDISGETIMQVPDNDIDAVRMLAKALTAISQRLDAEEPSAIITPRPMILLGKDKP